MSLRLRLTFLYTTLVGVVLLLFSLFIYGLASIVFITQIDSTLSRTSDQVISLLKVDINNQFDPRSLANFTPDNDLIIQVYNNDGRLQIAHPYGWLLPLDDASLKSRQGAYRSTTSGGTPVRVLSVPLKTVRGQVGMIQVGATLTLVQNVQESLVSAVIILSLVAIFLTGLGTWLITSRALKPLSTVTRVATQITRADDLSRRIPLRAGRNDEVGTLIRSFNATLERLETLFNSQRRFLADVSHELRTPLTVIKGNVGLMRRIGQADEESLSGIETEVDRLTRMVGDLLLLAQAEQGQLPLDMQMVELDTVLLEVFQQMRVLGGERVKVNLSEIDQIHVLGDRDRLKQVMVNLAANAVQYTPNGGTVTMGLGSINQQARIIISDTGRGIPPEDLEHIFERFYRGEKSRTRSKDSGFGLGLSIAYWIVRAHNGHIEVASQEGSGTTFTVWLPLNAPEESPLLPPVTDEKKDPS